MIVNGAAYPYSTVVCITDTIGGEGWQASGVLLSPDEVLTATHAVYTTGIGAATNIEVKAFDNNGTGAQITDPGIAVHYSNIDDSNHSITFSDSQNDFAVIHLAHPLAVGTMGYQAGFSGGAVHITGYPASANGEMVDSQQSVFLDSPYSLFDGQSIGAGSSGGPVWISQNGAPEVVGLVSTEDLSTGAGYFTQITGSVASQIQSWLAQDDGATGAAAGTVAFAAGGGNSAFNGSGQDIVTFHGNLASYNLAISGTNGAIITDSVAGRDGTTQVSNVQFLEFQDKTVIMANGDDAIIARIYSLFGRAPDVRGLDYWEGQYADVPAATKLQGASAFLGIVSAFIHSGEFHLQYGQPDDSQFVSLLYQTILGRLGDAAGLAYWDGVLAAGGNQDAVAFDFVNSAENINRVDITKHPATGWLLLA